MEESLKQQLRDVGLRATPARAEVLRILTQHAKPLDVKEILHEIGPDAVDQATMYRILQALVRVGLAKEVHVHAGVVSYEIASLKHHHHVVCEKCGYVEDVSSCNVPASPRVPSFASVDRHSLEFFGVCKSCAV